MTTEIKPRPCHDSTDAGAAPSRRIVELAILVSLACSPLILLLFLLSETREWTVFLGRFHPALLHLPIGVLIITILLEFLMVLSRGKLGYSSRLLTFVCALTTVATAVLGILLVEGDSMQGPLVESHLLWGVVTAVLVLLALILRCLPQFTTHSLWQILYRGVLLLSLVVLVWASHQGASLTHGSDYLSEHLPWKKSTTNKREAYTAMTRDTVVSYKRDIVPIFEAKCNSCHKTAYYKGELIMDTYDELLEGGLSGPGIIPGYIDESLVVARILLPISDEEHMPPKNKTQITPEELEIIKQWIHQGAKM